MVYRLCHEFHFVKSGRSELVSSICATSSCRLFSFRYRRQAVAATSGTRREWTSRPRPCYNNRMPNLHSPEGASFILQVLVSAFLAILFLQSGLDKGVDRRGNREYLDQHFAKSPLGGTVGPMFAVITLLEVSAGALSGVGCVLLLLTRDSTVAYLGAVVAAINIVALFFGQRLSKDYAGAAVLVPYFLLALSGIYFLAEH